MKEEWREQGLSESEIGELVQKAQKALEAEKGPTDIEGIKGSIGEAGEGTPELKAKTDVGDSVKETLEEYHPEYVKDKENHQRATDAIRETAKLEQGVGNIPELARKAILREQAGIRTLWIGITPDFVSKGYIDLRGHKA